MELTSEDLNFFSEFEKITRVMPKDYYSSLDFLIFLIEPTQLGKAIGKKGANIPKLRSIFRKNVVIVGDAQDHEMFIRNMFNNVRIFSIDSANIMDEKTLVVTVDEKDRGLAIGKNGDRIKAAKEFLKRKFNSKLVLRTKRVLNSDEMAV